MKPYEEPDREWHTETWVRFWFVKRIEAATGIKVRIFDWLENFMNPELIIPEVLWVPIEKPDTGKYVTCPHRMQDTHRAQLIYDVR